MKLNKFFPILILLIIAALSLWIIPKLQCLDLGKTPEEHFQLVNESRKTLAQILGGAFLLFGLYLTWRRITATEKQVTIAQEEQITERFTRAIDQLGNNKIEIRLGGIYALERIAIDSAKDHWTIIEVLIAFLRKHNVIITQDIDKHLPCFSADILAILRVLSRRKLTYNDGESIRIDLSQLDLRGVTLVEANLRGANLLRAHLEKADLTNAQLQGAWLAEAFLNNSLLREAQLQDAELMGAKLENAFLKDANLKNARLIGANLDNAFLVGADLEGADLEVAHLKGTNLTKSNLLNTNIKGAYLKGADLRDSVGLTKEQIVSANTDEDTKLPNYLVIV